MITKDGTRKVTPMTLDGRSMLLITRHPSGHLAGFVPMRMKNGVLTDDTIARLAALGVEIGELEDE
jgi:hypothetical protein